jgi:ABC-type Fe3+-hydroxamate transport system substrate-binding protein
MKLCIKWIKIIFLFFVISNSIQAFGNVPSIKEQIKNLKFKETPKYVACLSLMSAEIFTVLGEKPIGFSKTNSGAMPDYLMNNLKNVEDVGTLASPSFERMLELKRKQKLDLILVDRIYQYQSEVGKFEKIAPVINFRPENYRDTMDQLKEFGKLFQKEKEADKFINDFYENVKIVKEKAKKHPTSVLAFFVTQNKIWTWTDKSFLASILSEINIQYAYSGPGGKDYSDFVEMSAEKLLEIDPDQLIVFEDPGKNIISYMNKNPVWKTLNAVKNKNVIVVDRDIWSRSRGPIAALTIVKSMGNTFK